MEVLSDLNDCYDSKISTAVVVVERLSEEVIKKYDKDFERCVERCEPSIGYITETQFMSYLGLISTKQLNSKSMEELKQSFPIRDISRIGPQLKNQKNDLILDKSQIVSNYVKKVVFRPPKRRSGRRSGRKKLLSLTQKDIVRQHRLDEQKKLQKTNEKEETKIKSLITLVSMSSEWFIRLYRTFGYELLSDSEVSKMSQVSKMWLKPLSVGHDQLNIYSQYKYNDWNTSNIEQKSMRSEMAFKLHPKDHIFTFTRRQRIEKSLRLSCRLSWRMRLEKSRYIKPLTIKAVKLKDCPICWRPLTEDHCCDHPSPPSISHQMPSNVLIAINGKSFE